MKMALDNGFYLDCEICIYGYHIPSCIVSQSQCLHVPFPLSTYIMLLNCRIAVSRAYMLW